MSTPPPFGLCSIHPRKQGFHQRSGSPNLFNPVAVVDWPVSSKPSRLLRSIPEFEVTAAVWRPLLGFPPLCPVPSPDEIGVYSISFGSISPSVVREMPWTHLTMLLIFGQRQEIEDAEAVEAFRSDIVGKPVPATTLNVVSTFNWDANAVVVHVPLTHRQVEMFQKCGYSCAIVNNNFWKVTSAVEPCRRLRLTDDLDNQAPVIKMDRHVGKLPAGAEMRIRAAMGRGFGGGMFGGPMGGLMEMMRSMMSDK